MKLVLATSILCGPCYVLRCKLSAKSIVVDTKELSDVNDKEFYTKYNIRSVPTLVVLGYDGVLLETIKGIDDIIKKIEEHAKTKDSK